MAETLNAYRVFVRKPVPLRQLGRPKRRWEKSRLSIRILKKLDDLMWTRFTWLKMRIMGALL
jgi:hypothetical protein